MDELIKMVAKKTGLTEAKAKVAVELVLDFLKKKLPKAVGAQIDIFLKNEGQLADAADLVGDLLGAAAKAQKTTTKSKK